MKRISDVVLSIVLLVVLCIPMALIAVAIKLTSKGPVLHWSDRIGKRNAVFKMPKFRSMRTDAPQVATHLLRHPRAYLTPIGGLLRRTSLDELPQLFSVVMGQLSLVGPRPALFNQDDLVTLRTQSGVHELMPGITGWAQVNGWRGNTSIQKRLEFDLYYLRNWSIAFDCKIILLTVFRGLSSSNAY